MVTHRFRVPAASQLKKHNCNASLGIAVHNLLRLQKAEAIAYTACYPRDVAGAQPSATDYHKTPLALFGWGDSD